MLIYYKESDFQHYVLPLLYTRVHLYSLYCRVEVYMVY